MYFDTLKPMNEPNSQYKFSNETLISEAFLIYIVILGNETMENGSLFQIEKKEK